MAKLTQWFPGTVKPSRPGVYNVSCWSAFQTGRWYGRFDGEKWFGSWATDPRSKILSRPDNWSRNFDGVPASWRGLAKEPKHA